MATKSQISQEINGILGTDLEFEDMPKEDLELLQELVEGGALIEPLVKHMVKEHGEEYFEKQVDDWYPGKIASHIL